MRIPNKVNGMVEICAPFAGVVRYAVGAGDKVSLCEPIAIVEAVKLEVPVLAPCDAQVKELSSEPFANVDGGDVLALIVPNTRS